MPDTATKRMLPPGEHLWICHGAMFGKPTGVFDELPIAEKVRWGCVEEATVKALGEEGAAPSAAGGGEIPEGWALVPLEPTPKMLATYALTGAPEFRYAKMIAASPSQGSDTGEAGRDPSGPGHSRAEPFGLGPKAECPSRSPAETDWLDQPTGGELQFDGMRFGRGVPLRTVIKAAQRWRRDAVAAFEARVESNRKEVMSNVTEPCREGRASGNHVDHPREEVRASGGAVPCFWGGGNDVIWCATCGAEYAYAKGEERPPCPRAASCDGGGEAGETAGLDPKGNSAVGAAETPDLPTAPQGADLAGLSAAATQGEWFARPLLTDQGSPLEEMFISDERGNLATDLDATDARFIVALVNAYRSGALVPTTSAPPAPADRIAPKTLDLIRRARQAASAERALYGASKDAGDLYDELADALGDASRVVAPTSGERGGWLPMDDCPTDSQSVWVLGGQYKVPCRRNADGAYWRTATAKGLGGPTLWHPDIVPAPPLASRTEGERP